MAEFVFPGVFVEETSFRAHPIEGVSTSTAAFVGLTAQGLVGASLGFLTSFGDFERAYGGLGDLTLNGVTSPNYLAHAARAFFENGGQRLYVERVADSAPKAGDYHAAFARLLALGDVSIVAAPGAAALPDPLPAEVNRKLIAHAEAARSYRFAVLDPPPNLSVAAVGALGDALESRSAALYYPWVVAADPGGLALPPSGFVAGIYARVDAQRGVGKAPANEVVVGAMRLQRQLSLTEQAALNAAGVNAIRTLPARGIRVWGARTLSADAEWKYVNVRRYLTYLEASIDRGTQWAVFEPNGERLWAAITTAVTDFLFAEWRNGALQGTKAQEAFFVRCDRTTMTQADIDNGRLVCLVGVATVKPAEFVILRIGQMTAGSGSTDPPRRRVRARRRHR